MKGADGGDALSSCGVLSCLHPPPSSWGTLEAWLSQTLRTKGRRTKGTFNSPFHPWFSQAAAEVRARVPVGAAFSGHREAPGQAGLTPS